jgi:hypothetical protein
MTIIIAVAAIAMVTAALNAVATPEYINVGSGPVSFAFVLSHTRPLKHQHP